MRTTYALDNIPEALKAKLLREFKITTFPKLTIEDIAGDIEDERPKKRCDCKDGPRPCPWVMCAWHMLWLVKSPTYYRDNTAGNSEARAARHGTDEDIIALIESLPHSCVLDICDLGKAELEIIGKSIGTTRERVRQIEAKSLRKMKHHSRSKKLRSFKDHENHQDEAFTAQQYNRRYSANERGA